VFEIVLYNGLSLIDPKATTKSLLVNWVIKALEDGKSNLCFLIHFKLQNARPDRKKKMGISGSDGCF
jgi:hypothetical protein